jgi:hypothetical protein
MFGCLLLLTSPAWGRLPTPEGSEDLIYLGDSAQFIFHARVENPGPGVATLHVDRWYKGKPQVGPVRLQYEFWPDQVYNCIDLHRTDTWLIFARKTASGVFQFSHDCSGGLPMSCLLAPVSGGTWMERLQRDLIAGLNDNNPSIRLANIARLGGLKMSTSAQALRQFIREGTASESQWALYAAIRSGDLSELARAERLVINIEEPTPNPGTATARPRQDAAPSRNEGLYGVPGSIAIALEQLRDPAAVPALVRILRSAKTELVRSCVSQALEEIADPRSVPALAEALDDSSRYVRWDALVGLSHLANSADCTVPVNEPQDSEDVREARLSRHLERCKTWWATTGSLVVRPAVQ